MNYLKSIAALPQLRGIKTAVALDGPNQGHRLIFAPGLVLDAQPKNTPLAASLPVLSVIPETCTLSLGGSQVFVEVLDSPPELVICGAGHVALALIPMAKKLGFQVSVAEDREEFAQGAEDAGADPVYCMPFQEALGRIPGGENTYFVILTREHLYDQKCLEQILPKEWAYVGMMGSKGRTELVRKRMAQKGFDQARIDAVYAPIGLDIGAQTPEEIALSIMAQIISVYRKSQRGGSYSKELLEQGKKGDQILATIVGKEGSAPRGLGTKLLISATGQTGTIGGGLLEAQVVEKAREMLESGEPVTLSQMGLTPAQTEDTMACGGLVTVLLERLDP